MSTWGKSSPEHTTDEAEPQRLEFARDGLETVAGGPLGWRLKVAVAVLAIAVGALWLKPWTGSSIPTPSAFSSAAPTAPASPPQRKAPPTLDPVTVAARRRQCQSPLDWRVITAETTAARRTRTMYASSPSSSSGPTDRMLPLSHAYAGVLRAVGLCVPQEDYVDAAAELGRVVLWQVHADGTAREIADPVVIDLPLYQAGEAYWAPPSGDGQTWPAGRYVFEIRPAVGGPSRWLGIEFIPVRPNG